MSFRDVAAKNHLDHVLDYVIVVKLNWNFKEMYLNGHLFDGTTYNP